MANWAATCMFTVVDPAGVNSLHALLLGSGSEFMAAHYSSEGLLDVVVGPWKAAADPDCLRARQASYIKKLNIPFAPKQCHVSSCGTSTQAAVLHARGFCCQDTHKPVQLAGCWCIA